MKPITRDEIHTALSQLIERLESLCPYDEDHNPRTLPSNTWVHHIADEVSKRLVTLRVAILHRGLEAAEPLPFEKLTAQLATDDDS
jgi:hypothetical protein